MDSLNCLVGKSSVDALDCLEVLCGLSRLFLGSLL